MVANTSHCRLSGFGIKGCSSTGAATEVYANGRHQCEVIIHIVKEIINANGEWVHTPLTDEERASVTLVECSQNSNQALTQGWSCDEEKNQFTLGLWQVKSSQEDQRVNQVELADHTIGERIKRYLRCDPDTATGPVVLMARVAIDGRIYTTNSPDTGAGFESSISINSVRPIQLSESNIELYVDYSAYQAGPPYRTEVDVYYWTLPHGLWIKQNLGFETPLGSPGEGKDFQSVLAYQNPLDPDASNRVGTFLNKDDPESSLFLDEIYEGLPAPSPNPAVRFNERPTVMRAIRLRSNIAAENRDTKSVWKLLDNFGTEYNFLVKLMGGVELPGVPYFKLVGGAIMTVRLTTFEVVLGSEGPGARFLYANDRHQCKVRVEVTAERQNPDYSWSPMTLSDSERDSVTVTRYSPNLDEPLPLGWSCDREKNMFDTGLWQKGAISPTSEGNADPVKTKASPLNEVIERYMRVSATVPIEPQKFMASIHIGGKTFTTNPASGGVDSSVTIDPIRPYQVRVADLIEFHDKHAQNDNTTDVDVYYYTMPSGLSIVSNRGLDNPLSVENEGVNFQTSFCERILYHKFTRCKAGIVVSKDFEGAELRVNDIQHGYYSGGNPYVRFDMVKTFFRVVKLWGKKPITQGNTSSIFRVWDNFGCEHKFFMVPKNHDLDVELKDG